MAAYFLIGSFTLIFHSLFFNQEWHPAIPIIFILFVGIPHGALDHILLAKQPSFNPKIFNICYAGIIIMYSLLWVYCTTFSFFLFLIISAYHFGQSQFSDLSLSKAIKRILYISWGFSIISALVIYNHNDILNGIAHLGSVSLAIYKPFWTIALFSGSGIFFVMCCYLILTQAISFTRIIIEISILMLIHVSFLLLPAQIAFTVYFCTLHALRVSEEEFEFLKRKNEVKDLGQYLKLLAPFSIGSSAFILIVSYGVHTYFLTHTRFLFVFFILLSILTLPHSMVMEVFYKIRRN